MAEKEKAPPAQAPAAEGAPAPAASNTLPLFIAIIILVPAICYGMVEFLFMPRLLKAAGAVAEAKAANPHSNKKKSEQEITLDFGKTMVSLAGSGGNRYLRANIVLASHEVDLPNIVAKNEVALRDAVITVMSAFTLKDVEGGDGREVVRRALLARLNGILGGDIISQIYFTEFVIQ